MRAGFSRGDSTCRQRSAARRKFKAFEVPIRQRCLWAIRSRSDQYSVAVFIGGRIMKLTSGFVFAEPDPMTRDELKAYLPNEVDNMRKVNTIIEDALWLVIIVTPGPKILVMITFPPASIMMLSS